MMKEDLKEGYWGESKNRESNGGNLAAPDLD
jgi:hypothetical protein